jgi:zinc transporter ZupT
MSYVSGLPGDALGAASGSDGDLTPGKLAAVVSVPVATMLLGSFFAYFAQPPERVRAIVSAMAGGLLIGSVGFEMAPLLVKENGGHPMRIKDWNGGVMVGLGVSLVVTSLLTIISNALEDDDDDDNNGDDRNADGDTGGDKHKHNGSHSAGGNREGDDGHETRVQVGDRGGDGVGGGGRRANERDALLPPPAAPPRYGPQAVVPGESMSARAARLDNRRRRRHASVARAAKAAARLQKRERDRHGLSHSHSYDYGYGSGATRMFEGDEAGLSCGSCCNWLKRCFSAGRCASCCRTGIFQNYPLGPVVLVFIDGLSDGLLTGISANLTLKQGWIIAASLAVEMTFTGAALSSILLDRKANRMISLITLAIVPMSMYVGSLSGNAAISILDQNSPTFAGMIAFATGQIFYLASVELIGDALTMARDVRWPSFMILFDAAVLGGFMVGVAMQLLLPE